MDANPEKSRLLQIPDHEIHSDPNWVAKGTIVAVIGRTKGDTIALIDVSDPRRPAITEVLWQKQDGPDVEPFYPVYSAATRRCVFVGVNAKGGALYSIQKGRAGSAKPLGPRGYEPKITGLTYSPDSRYLIYSVLGPAPTHEDKAPAK